MATFFCYKDQRSNQRGQWFFVPSFFVVAITPLKFNMELGNDGFQVRFISFSKGAILQVRVVTFLGGQTCKDRIKHLDTGFMSCTMASPCHELSWQLVAESWI